MNKYTNPRSKRKLKAKVKREAREMCQAFTNHQAIESVGAYAQSPDEFIRAENRETWVRNEPMTLAKERPLSQRVTGAIGKVKKSRDSKQPNSRHSSIMNEQVRYPI